LPGDSRRGSCHRATIEYPDLSLHEIIAHAAEGTLPEWSVAGDGRRAHMARVAAVMGSWALEMGLSEPEQARWRAAGLLHDALRDEDPDVLRDRLPVTDRALPGPLLHGPAVAERLRIAGVLDGELLLAVASHTTGEPRLGTMGRALYAADFLEPGRAWAAEWAAVRDGIPSALADGVFRVAQARTEHRIRKEGRLLPRSVAFWNRLVEERR